MARFIAAAQHGFYALVGIQEGVIDQRGEIGEVAQAGWGLTLGPSLVGGSALGLDHPEAAVVTPVNHLQFTAGGVAE